MNKIFELFSQLKFLLIILHKEKWFLAWLLLFTFAASAALKVSYSYLLERLPSKEEMKLPVGTFHGDLTGDLKLRMAYLNTHVSGVGFRMYRISMKDNLWKISKRYGYSVHTII